MLLLSNFIRIIYFLYIFVCDTQTKNTIAYKFLWSAYSFIFFEIFSSFFSILVCKEQNRYFFIRFRILLFYLSLHSNNMVVFEWFLCSFYFLKKCDYFSFLIGYLFYILILTKMAYGLVDICMKTLASVSRQTLVPSNERWFVHWTVHCGFWSFVWQYFLILFC